MDPIDERLTAAGAAWRSRQPEPAIAWEPPAAAPWWERAMGPSLRLAGAAVLGLAVVGLLVAVSPRDAVHVAVPTSQPVVLLNKRPIALLTAATASGECAAGVMRGRLMREERSGLGLRSLGTVPSATRVWPVRWPYGFSARTARGTVELVDAYGTRIAAEGEELAIGGAQDAEGILDACDATIAREGPRSGAPNVSRPLTSEELVALARSVEVGGPRQMVVADAAIVRIQESTPFTCRDGYGGPTECEIGHVAATDGARISAWASEGVEARLPAGAPEERGLLAFAVSRGAVLDLGRVEAGRGGTLVRPATETGMAGTDDLPDGTLIAVDGWLAFEPGRCAAAIPGTPARRCGLSTVVAGDAPPDPRASIAFMIPVQSAAYDTFAAIPSIMEPLPRRAVWLLRHVPSDPGQAPGLGWEVIGRLDPLPAGTTIDRLDPPMPSAAPGRTVIQDAVFRLTLDVGRTAWLADEVIPVGATIEYIGGAPSITVRTGAGVIVGFGVEHLDGPVDSGPSWLLSCVPVTFEAGDIRVIPLRKSGGYDPSGPDAPFWIGWFNQPQLRLPGGTYRIYALAHYSLEGCGPSSELTADVTTTVTDPVAAPSAVAS